MSSLIIDTIQKLGQCLIEVTHYIDL